MRRSITLAFLGFGLSACSGGSLGDPLASPNANELGNGARIHQVVGVASWVNPSDMMSQHCTSPQDANVYVTGATVVAIDRFDETGTGSSLGNYYLEDTDPEAADYSGITVFGASFSPPDLRVGEDDVVDILGTYSEFLGPSSGSFGQCYTLPEFTGTISFRYDGNNPPPARKIDVNDLTSYANGRKHLGQLVVIENVTLDDNGTNKSGRYTAPIHTTGGDTVTISNELYDLEKDPGLMMTDKFKTVTGIVTYFYGFHIAPRSSADLVK